MENHKSEVSGLLVAGNALLARREMKLSEFVPELDKNACNSDIINAMGSPKTSGTASSKKIGSDPMQNHIQVLKYPLRRQNTAPPSFVPAYLKRIGQTNRAHDIQKRSFRLKTSAGLDSDYAGCKRSNLSLHEIRKKYTNKICALAMPVKEKVALMEKWNQGSDGEKPKLPAKRTTSANVTCHNNATGTQLTKVQFRGLQKPVETKKSGRQAPPKPRRTAREARQRRSMSDPNLHKSFQAMKELWDKKVESDSKPQLVQHPRPTKTRGSSVSSNQSVDNDHSLKHQTDEHPCGGSDKKPMLSEKKKGPPTPTNPKPIYQLRTREEYPGDASKKAHSTADQSAGNLVKNRAKMFDTGKENKTSTDVNRTSLNRNKARSSTTDESYSVSARKTATEIAARQDKSPARHSVNNNDKICAGDTKSELAKLLDYEQSQERDAGEDLMSRMRRNSANSAKERRRQHHHRRGSNHSDSDSSSVASSLSSTSVEGPVVLRRTGSKEESIMDKPGNSPSVIRSYLHRSASPKNVQKSPTLLLNPPPGPESIDSTGRRGSFGSIASSGSVSLQSQITSRRQSSLHKEHTSYSNRDLEELEDSPTAALHRKLSIDAAKRVSMSTDSGTGTVSPRIARNSRSSAKSVGCRDSISSTFAPSRRGGSFSSVLSAGKTPPAPPPSSDKPTRPRSASSSPMPVHHHVTRPTFPPPPPPTVHKRSKSAAAQPRDNEDDRISMGSTTTISSRMSLLSRLGDGTFNAEDEYNRILDVIATPTSTKRYRSDSIQSSNEDFKPRLSNSGDVVQSTALTRPMSISNRDSLEVPGRKYRTSDNDSYSDYEPSDADDEGNQMALTPSTVNQTAIETAPKQKVPVEVKLHNIAKELLSTEITYVDRLNLIDQIFHKRVLEAIGKKQISSDVKNIFSNVSAIYQFHNEFLLPQLKARLESWNTNPKLGNIMTQAAPFLKMYSLYVQNFDEAMTMIRHWTEKSINFVNIIKQIQAMEECGNLSLEHHMLSPVQRIPRYKMLLEDYLKRLPEDSPDRPESETALQLISQAATHSNESMRQSDKFNKLLRIYNNLVDINFDIVDVSRELILEGKIIKISARNGEKHERYLYLFNDMLLVCTSLRRLQRKSYKVAAKIELDGLQITDVTNMTIPNTFCVNGTKKSLELATNTPEEKEKWVNAIGDAIDSFLERKTSFMKSGSQRIKVVAATDDLPPGSPLHTPDCQPQLRPASPRLSPTHGPIFDEVDFGNEEKRIEITLTPGNQYLIDIEDHDLGKRAPRWIKDNEVTMCMHCSKAFNRLLRRRHHCRACGRVICTECSEHKLELQYDHGKPHKVCNKCHAVLTGRKKTETDKKGVLETEADIVSGDSILSEYLYFADADKRKAWTKMWCVIPNNEPCLYIYGANQDVRAAMTMPLPGFTVVEDATIDRDYSFKLSQARKVMFFAASSQGQKDRWKFVFEKAALGKDLTREDVYNFGKMQDQLRELQDEAASTFSMNGSRLSSSSGESSSVSTCDSSRPSSMSKTSSYPDMNDTTTQGGQNIIEGTVA